jgi:hypothetical protein
MWNFNSLVDSPPVIHSTAICLPLSLFTTIYYHALGPHRIPRYRLRLPSFNLYIELFFLTTFAGALAAPLLASEAGKVASKAVKGGIHASSANSMSDPFSGSSQTALDQAMQQQLPDQQLAMNSNNDEFRDLPNLFDPAHYNPSSSAKSFDDKKNVAHVKWSKASDKTHHGK